MKHVLAILSLLAVAACDGNPFPPGTPGGGPDTPPDEQPVVVPTNISFDLKKVVYTPGTASKPASLKIQITGLDTTPLTATWKRNPNLDVPGYQAFSIQEDALDRLFVGLAKASSDRSVSAVVAGDGGQFSHVFQGASYSRSGAYTPPAATGSGPATGQVSYAGNYAGLMNVGINGSELLTPPSGTDPELLPGQPVRTRGQAFINANFADNTVSGTVYNRRTVDTNFGLESVVLVPATITANGTFEGTVRRPNQGTVFDEQVGTAGGVFGGRNASGLAGAVSLDNVYDRQHNQLDNVTERGIFVLDQCGLKGVPVAAGCKGTAP